MLVVVARIVFYFSAKVCSFSGVMILLIMEFVGEVE